MKQLLACSTATHNIYIEVGDEVSCWELNRRGVPQGSVLGPMCFNVFLNDLSYFILRISLNAYADDQQLYGADSDHEALYARLDHELREALQWFRMNGLMANPSKFQVLVLGSTEQDFSFNIDGQQIQRCDDVDLLGVNIDSKLSFDKHISSICSKVNKQLSVVKRFKHLIGDHIKRRFPTVISCSRSPAVLQSSYTSYNHFVPSSRNVRSFL